tara:strand:- start:3861 stop:4139 length:279 start_codon:yes stop_codon:yes gene_type:complete
MSYMYLKHDSVFGTTFLVETDDIEMVKNYCSVLFTRFIQSHHYMNTYRFASCPDILWGDEKEDCDILRKHMNSIGVHLREISYSPPHKGETK